MTPPSKELLSAVFGKKIGKIETKGVYLEYEHWENCINHQKQDISGYDITRINIHELGQKIKVWAFEQGYIVDEIGKYVLIIEKDTGVTKHRIDNDFYEVGDVDWSDIFDISSVFKAGEWILNQQDKGI